MPAPFFEGFSDELQKLAVDPKITSWALSRGLTAGLGAGLMGAGLSMLSNSNRPKSQRKSVGKTALTTAAIGSMTGLGKGFLEKGLEKKIMRFATKLR